MNIFGTGDVLGKAVVEITADSSKYNKALDKAHAGLKSFSGAAPMLLKGVGVAFAGVTAAATAVTAAVTAVAIKGLREFAQFQQGAAEISTLLRGDVDETMRVLEAGVRGLSLQIPQSTALMNKALYDIISAGVDAGESLTILGQSGRAAVAGVSEIGTSAKLVTSVINALGMQTKDAEKIFDVAFGTVRAGVTTFAELAGSVGDVLPPASKLGVELEELFGSMAYLTKVGQSSAEASTALGRAFEALIEHAGELEGFGVDVFGKEGEFIGVLNVMRQISGVIDGLSEKERADVLAQMGLTEIRAQRAIIPMITNFREFEKVVNDVTNSAGAMETAYSRMEGTLANQWNLLKNAVAELYTTIGEKFAGIAASGIQSITELVNKVSTLLGSTQGGLGQVWADHAELVTTIISQMAVSAIETIGVMVTSLAKTIGQTAYNVLQEAIDPKRIKQDYALAFETFGEAIKAIARGDIEELDDIYQRALLKQEVTLEEYRKTQTSASAVMAKSIGEGIEKVTSQYRASYNAIEAKIDEHLDQVTAAAKETSAEVVNVADTTVTSVANAVRRATGVVVPALEAQKYEFMAIQDDITVITRHQEKERTRDTQKELQTRDLVFREYNDKWTWFNDERFQDWKESSDKILATESTAQGQLARINARGRSEILGQQKKNAAEIAVIADESAKYAVEKIQEKNEKLIGSETTTKEILEQTAKDMLNIRKTYWDEYVNMAADGVYATANVWKGLYEVWHNTEMEWDKFHRSSLGKLANWVDKVAGLINNAKVAWNSLNTVIATIGKLFGTSGGGLDIGSPLGGLIGGTTKGGGASILGKIGGGIKAGAGAIAGLPWGSIAGTAAGLAPAAAAGLFTAGVFGFMGKGLWDMFTDGGGTRGTVEVTRTQEEWLRIFEQNQRDDEIRYQQAQQYAEGQRQREQMQLELARYSLEELKRIYEIFPELRTYMQKTWQDIERRSITGGRDLAAGGITIQAGVVVADEYSLDQLAEKLAPKLQARGL
jgi:TP901 family phage tail tape measure protein